MGGFDGTGRARAETEADGREITLEKIRRR